MAVPIWRDPWMWVGHGTYADDVLRRLGAHTVLAGERYPAASPGDVLAARPDVVLLPDEPYAFGPNDGPDALPGVRTVPVPGRPLFWYGPAMASAPQVLLVALTGTTGSSPGAAPTGAAGA